MSQLTTNNTSSRTSKSSILKPNPIMRRLENVDEHSETNSATYGGIAVKTIFFLLFSVAGIVIQVVLKPMLQTGNLVEASIKNFPISLRMTEIWVLLGVVLAGIVFQLLAAFAKPTTPVTGALYSATQGYLIAFLVFSVLPEDYRYLGLLALAITLMIILVMAILYATGAIRVTKKFKMVILTLFITVVGSSLLLLVASFIPFTSGLVAQLRNNYALSIGVSVVFIIIAALFLICDFDTIDRVVKDKLPKKYEWGAAFGLSFTVLWLYLKVLDLIMTIAGNNRD